MPNVSVLVLTLDEEDNLPGCLESVSWSDDVVVLDSLSRDRTREIAKQAGARVFERRFDNWSSHQNWALAEIDFRHPWVYYTDADERVPPELRDEMLAIASDPTETRVAFYARARNSFMGRWLDHAFASPPIMRFFKPPHVRFDRRVNPVAVVDGPHGHLRHPFLHYSFARGLTHWFHKHNAYSQMEAEEGLRLLRGDSGIQPSVFDRDPVRRRRALKNLSFRMPLRPLLKFLYLYVGKLGFLDGRPGLTYCVMQSIYEYMIVLKMREIRIRERGGSI